MSLDQKNLTYLSCTLMYLLSVHFYTCCHPVCSKHVPHPHVHPLLGQRVWYVPLVCPCVSTSFGASAPVMCPGTFGTLHVNTCTCFVLICTYFVHLMYLRTHYVPALCPCVPDVERLNGLYLPFYLPAMCKPFT
jgi:hypothetical protein